jgi:hypothetical protein
VIDSKLIDIRDNRLDDDGYLFISPNLKNEAKQDDLVLKRDDDQLVASKRFNSKEDTLVGKVLAQEVRF